MMNLGIENKRALEAAEILGLKQEFVTVRYGKDGGGHITHAEVIIHVPTGRLIRNMGNILSKIKMDSGKK